MTTTWKKLLVLAATGVFVALSAGATASAHMWVATSNPVNGSSIAVAPQELTIRFGTVVELDTAVAQLRHVGGVDAPISDLTRRDVPTDRLTKLTGEGNGSDASFAMPELSAGLYAIDWGVDEVDGHNNSSTIVFKVTEGVEGKTPTTIYLAAGVLIAVVSFAAVTLLLRKRAR